MRRTLTIHLALTVLTTLVALPSCELPEEETAAGADVAAGDAIETAADASADATTDAAPADAIVSPIPCAALAGRWQVTLCGSNAASVQFLATGCSVLLSSADPTYEGGSGQLAVATLALSLPGGVYGTLRCEATMTRTSFTGECVAAGGTCEVAGVKSW